MVRVVSKPDERPASVSPQVSFAQLRLNRGVSLRSTLSVRPCDAQSHPGRDPHPRPGPVKIVDIQSHPFSRRFHGIVSDSGCFGCGSHVDRNQGDGLWPPPD